MLNWDDAMKKSIINKLEVIVIVGILICPVTLCTGLYLGDWVSHERTLQRWLDEDKRRVDLFQLYATYPSGEQLREILLRKLPPGSSEEEVKAFYLANAERDQKDWHLGRYLDENLVVLTYYAADRSHSHALQRMLGGKIKIIFRLNPVDNSLMDITVKVYGTDI